MFDRMANGWAIAQSSWGVIRRDPVLLVFPVLSGIACLLVLATFIAPVFAVPGLIESIRAAIDTEDANQRTVATAIAGAVAFLFYFVNYAVIVYFNTALVSCAIVRYQGGDPTLGDGLRMANSRLPQVLGWALLAATVGMILQLIEERSEFVGKIVIGIIGAVWTAVTYFVVPVLAVEGLGPIDALKRSAAILRQSWGEGMVGRFSLGLIGFLMMLPGIALLFVPAVLQLPTAVIVAGVVLGLVWLLASAVVVSAMKQVFVAGLYIYATENRVPSAFDAGMVRGAFGAK